MPLPRGKERPRNIVNLPQLPGCSLVSLKKHALSLVVIANRRQLFDPDAIVCVSEILGGGYLMTRKIADGSGSVFYIRGLSPENKREQNKRGDTPGLKVRKGDVVLLLKTGTPAAGISYKHFVPISRQTRHWTIYWKQGMLFIDKGQHSSRLPTPQRPPARPRQSEGRSESQELERGQSSRQQRLPRWTRSRRLLPQDLRGLA